MIDSIDRLWYTVIAEDFGGNRCPYDRRTPKVTYTFDMGQRSREKKGQRKNEQTEYAVSKGGDKRDRTNRNRKSNGKKKGTPVVALDTEDLKVKNKHACDALCAFTSIPCFRPSTDLSLFKPIATQLS